MEWQVYHTAVNPMFVLWNSPRCGKGKGKAVSLQAWSGPEGSMEVKVPKFHDNSTG